MKKYFLTLILILSVLGCTTPALADQDMTAREPTNKFPEPSDDIMTVVIAVPYPDIFYESEEDLFVLFSEALGYISIDGIRRTSSKSYFHIQKGNGVPFDRTGIQDLTFWIPGVSIYMNATIEDVS